MKRNIRISSVIIMTMLLVAPAALAQEAPAPTSDDIAQSCQASINSISSTRRPRDLRSRVDYLQAYQYIYQRFDIFVRRLERNNQPEAKELRATLNSLQKETETFKQAYEQYDQSRENLTSLKNCARQQEEFTNRLADARAKRALVNDSIQRANGLLSDTMQPQLQTLLNDLKKPLETKEQQQ